MAVTAKFIADFTSFSTAVDKAELKLRGFQSGAVGVEKALSRVGDSFSGRRLVQEATLATRALEQLGAEGGIAAGLTKLTGNELQRVGSLAREAADKLNRLGQEVPTNLQKIVDATAPIPQKLTLAAKAADLARSSFGQMFGAINAANLVQNAVGGLINMGKAAFESAGHISDLSAKLGISTEAIQRMEFVAKQTGSTVDDFASAAFKLGTRLAGGSDSVSAAVKTLGLNFQELQRLKPEQQFETVVGALGKMQDATARNQLGVELFGKSFEKIAAGVAADYEKLSKQANVSSDAQIQALDRAGDAWERFKNRASNSVVGFLGTVVLKMEAVNEIIGERGIFANTIGVLNEAQRRVDLGLVGQRKTDVNLGAEGAGGAAQKADDFVAQLQKMQAAVAALTSEQRAQIDAAQKLGGDALEKVIDRFGLSEEVIRLYTGSIKEGAKATRDFVKESDALFGRDAIAKAQDYVKMIGDVRNVSKLSAEKQKEVNQVLAEASEAYKRLGVNIPPSVTALRNAIQPVSVMAEELRKLETVVDSTAVSLEELSRIPPPFEAMANDLRRLETTFLTSGLEGLLTNLGDELKGLSTIAPPPATLGQNITGSLKGALGSTPQVILSALTGGGNVVKSVGGMFGTKLAGALAGGLDDKTGLFTNGVGKVLQKTLGKTIGGALGSVLPGIGTILGSLAGPLIAKIGGFFKTIFGGVSQREMEGRKAASSFRKGLEDGLNAVQRSEAAGIDGILRGNERWKLSVIAIRDAYLATGRTAEEALAVSRRLWEAEKQGADAVARVMAEINMVFEEQRADAERLNKAVEKYGFTLAELGPTFRKGQLDDQAKELIEDWRVLVNSGVSVATVNSKMAATFNEYLKAAVSAGVEVPAALRPILKSLADQGLLLDESGNKIVDISKIKFSETMTEGFDRIVQKLQELIDKLQGAGQAIDDLPKNIVFDATVRFHQAQRLADIQTYIERLEAMSGWSRLVRGLPLDIDKELERLLADPTAEIPKFHRGGQVNQWMKAHDGLMLKSDDVPVIAQTGERILSRDETRAYNQTSGGDVVIRIDQVNTNDAGSFVRDLPMLVRQNRHGVRSGLRAALGVT